MVFRPLVTQNECKSFLKRHSKALDGQNTSSFSHVFLPHFYKTKKMAESVFL